MKDGRRSTLPASAMTGCGWFAGSVDRLPSFITGPQPQVNVGANGGQPGFEGGGGGGERFPRRRRRPHGPRPEREAAPAASSDEVAPGE